MGLLPRACLPALLALALVPRAGGLRFPPRPRLHHRAHPVLKPNPNPCPNPRPNPNPSANPNPNLNTRCSALRDDEAVPSSEASVENPDTPAKNVTVAREFTGIAAPALFAIAAEPIASLTDTAFLGRLGADDLAAAGVAGNALYTSAKVTQDPLGKTSVSLVAGKDGAKLRASVEAAMGLAVLVGMCQGLLFTGFAPNVVSFFGLAPGTAAAAKASVYLRIRGCGAVGAALLLVVNGIYRGLGDTRTPMVFTLIGVATNIILDALLVFGVPSLGIPSLGASGAAIATVAAGHVAVIPLLLKLRKMLPKDERPSGMSIMERAKSPAVREAAKGYAESGTLILLRSVGKIVTYSYIGREAAKIGPAASAAYTLCFQLGVAITQLSESLAIAVQALVARYLHKAPERARRVVSFGVRAGFALSTTIVLASWFGRERLVHGLTTDAAVRAAVLAIMPQVLVAQVLKGLAYPANAVLLGGRDWNWSTAAMWASAGATMACLAAQSYFSGPAHGFATGVRTVGQLWWALSLFFGVQVTFSVLRYTSARGPWAALHSDETKRRVRDLKA